MESHYAGPGNIAEGYIIKIERRAGHFGPVRWEWQVFLNNKRLWSSYGGWRLTSLLGAKRFIRKHKKDTANPRTPEIRRG